MRVDAIKQFFKLKNKQSVHAKLIEVFSYRDDISQRKSIVEEVFHLLFSKHRFEVSKCLTIRRQEDILSSIKRCSDYRVYKSKGDFMQKVELLAEKILKEEIIIDQIAYQEGTRVTIGDVKHYLAMLGNYRSKELIYFRPMVYSIENSESPFQDCVVRQAVMREKTLNNIINSLTS